MVLPTASRSLSRFILSTMEGFSNEECVRDIEEEIPISPPSIEGNLESFYNYQMSRSKFQSKVVVRQYESKGLSFQLWPAANAVCWYLETEFGEEGMCIPDEENLSVLSSDRGFDTPKESVQHLPGFSAEDSVSGPVFVNYYRPSQNRRMKVLELGSGTGMVGIVAACLGAHVTLTDLPHVLPNAEHNMELNRGVITAAGGFVESHVLRWGVEEDVESLGNLSSFDIILASDVIYYDTLFKPLVQTLKWLVGAAGDDHVCPDRRKNQQRNRVRPQTAGPQLLVSHPPTAMSFACSSPEKKEDDDVGTVHKSAWDSAVAERGGMENVPLNKRGAEKAPVTYIGHVRRWKKDSHFFKQASKVFDVQVIHRYPPQDNARVGPIIYRLSVKPN